MEIKYWETASNRIPVAKFIADQPDDAAQRIMKNIEHFAGQGLGLLSVPSKMKQLTGYTNLYELKIDFKGMFYRIIFCVIRGVAHLLTAFKKKDNHTQKRHIKTALTRQKSLHNLVTI